MSSSTDGSAPTAQRLRGPRREGGTDRRERATPSPGRRRGGLGGPRVRRSCRASGSIRSGVEPHLPCLGLRQTRMDPAARHAGPAGSSDDERPPASGRSAAARTSTVEGKADQSEEAEDDPAELQGAVAPRSWRSRFSARATGTRWKRTDRPLSGVVRPMVPEPAKDVGLIELVRLGNRWTWERWSQGGELTAKAPRSFRFGWSAARHARRWNGQLPCFLVRPPRPAPTAAGPDGLAPAPGATHICPDTQAMTSPVA